MRTTVELNLSIVRLIALVGDPVILLKRNGSEHGLEASEVFDMPQSDYYRWRIRLSTIEDLKHPVKKPVKKAA